MRKVKPAPLASKTLVLAAALEVGESRIQIIVQPEVKPIQILISLDLWTMALTGSCTYLKVSIRYHGTMPPPMNSATHVTVEKMFT